VVAASLGTRLPDAVRVLDAFHVTRLGFAAVDQVRRRIQQELTGHCGRRDDPLYRIRRLLRRGYEHHCADAGVPELERLARTLDSWRTELLAYFDTDRISNGPEAINLLIKKIKHVGHGFRNFDNYRLRLLLHCGVEWNTPDATPIRGRLPRFIA
jgi:transposase